MVALNCVNSAKLELHFPEFFPHMTLGKDWSIFAQDLGNRSGATFILLLSEGWWVQHIYIVNDMQFHWSPFWHGATPETTATLDPARSSVSPSPTQGHTQSTATGFSFFLFLWFHPFWCQFSLFLHMPSSFPTSVWLTHNGFKIDPDSETPAFHRYF